MEKGEEDDKGGVDREAIPWGENLFAPRGGGCDLCVSQARVYWVLGARKKGGGIGVPPVGEVGGFPRGGM